MIAPTFGEMRTLLRVYIDDRNSDRWSDTELDLLLNEGQRQIQKRIELADQQHFVKCQTYDVVPADDTFEFSLPNDFRRAVQFQRNIAGGRPVPGNWVNFRRRHEDFPAEDDPSPEGEARPRVYIRGSKIGVVQPRNAYTATLWYTYNLPILAASGDFSEVPAEHRNLIVIYAAKLARGSDGGELARELRDCYDEGVAALTRDVQTRQVQQPRRVIEGRGP